jgi:hypothetical protein
MESDDQNQNKNDLGAHPAFVHLRDIHPQPSAFMKHRILARVGEKPQRTSKELWFWRALSAGALALCAVLAFRGHIGVRNVDENIAYAQQAYVIHVALNDERVRDAVAAGVELPEGVTFFSKTHPEVAELRSMELAITPGTEGPTRLPFVVRAEHAGIKQIKMKFYNANRDLIYEKEMSVRFAEKSPS